MTYPQQPGGWSEPSWPAADQPYSDPGYGAGYGQGYPTAYPGQPASVAPSGYGYGGYPAPVPMRGTNGLAIASLVVSLAGVILLGGIPAVAGAIMGHFARRQIRTRGEDGDGLALAGMIVGYIGFGLGLLLWGGLVLLFFIALAAAPSSPHY
jgi:hypothetical protein